MVCPQNISLSFLDERVMARNAEVPRQAPFISEPVTICIRNRQAVMIMKNPVIPRRCVVSESPKKCSNGYIMRFVPNGRKQAYLKSGS